MKATRIFALALMIFAGTAATAQAGGWYQRGGYPGPPPQQGGAYQTGGYRDAATVRHSPKGQPYLILRGGAFEPNDDPEGLGGYDSGWNMEFGFGSRVSAFFAVEGSVGSYGAEMGPDELQVVPVTVGGRFIIPGSFLEPYVGGGLGLYFARLDEAAVPPDYSGIDDSSTTAGGYFSMGVDTWISPRVALNMEGKYHFADAPFMTNAGNEVDVDMSGWTLNLGVRFEF